MRKVSAATWVILVTVAGLAGCWSHPEPSQYDDVVMGPNVRVGSIQLRSVHVEAPPDPAYSAGSDARLWLTLRNDGREPDALVAVDTAAATRAEIRWDDDCDGEFRTVDRLTLKPAEPVPQRSPTGVPVFDAYHIRLVGLNREVTAGTTIPVTFRFERAGAITVSTPVQPSVPRAEPSARCAPGPSASERVAVPSSVSEPRGAGGVRVGTR